MHEVLQAIIFDMDGLMIDSEPLARRAWDKVLAVYGARLDETTYRRMIGLRLEESARLVRDTYRIPDEPAVLAERKQFYLADIRAHGVPAMPGLMPLMAEVERRCLPWAVATSSKRADALTVLRQLDLLAACRAVAAGDEVSLGKPAPDVYLLAAARLQVLPQACLALEDSPPGVLAAKAAGMVTAAIPNGSTKGGDFSSADFLLSSLYEVTLKLDRLMGPR